MRDSGLVLALLNISTYDGFLGHPVAGNSWEGFVVENILSICPRNWVIHLGDDEYKLPNDITIVSLEKIMQKLIAMFQK